MSLKLADISHYNIFLQAMEQALDKLITFDFSKPLSATQGHFIYRYVDEKIEKVVVPDDIRGQLWNSVITEYWTKYGSNENLVQDLTKNTTCIHLYQGELIRWFIKNNKEILDRIWEQ